MFKHVRLALGLMVPLGVIVAVIIPATAQAAPHWYKAGTKLPETGAETAVTLLSKGLVLNEKTVKAKISCETKDEAKIFNPTGAGSGKSKILSISVLNNPCPTDVPFCKVKTVAEGLEWETQLAETAGVIRDDIKGIKIKITFEGASCMYLNKTARFVGELNPRFVNGTTGGEAGCQGATLTDSRLEFDANSGVLKRELGKEEKEEKAEELNLEGVDCIWAGTNEAVTVANP
jgi:hypothetical protein